MPNLKREIKRDTIITFRLRPAQVTLLDKLVELAQEATAMDLTRSWVIHKLIEYGTPKFIEAFGKEKDSKKIEEELHKYSLNKRKPKKS